MGAVGLIAWAALALPRASAWPIAGAAALLGALVVALALKPVTSRVPEALVAIPSRVFVTTCALVAAAISYVFVHATLHEAPLSIDASVYLMEARAIAHGSFGAPIPEPALAFGQRFLFEGADGRMYGVFPPGYPLFVALFVKLGVPMLAGPVTAGLLVLAQYALGRAVGIVSRASDDGELATRASLLLTLPSFARAIETADLLSHAFVAVLVTTALACALFYAARPSRALAAAIGACVGWTISARLLDGVVAAAVVVVTLAVVHARRSERALPIRPLALALAAALPFLALLAAEQRVATGSVFTPTQSEYFARSDYPPQCHRLGFGADIGCNVEHPDAVAKDGADGYRIDDALRVTRERASVLGEDLFGFAPIGLLAFLLLVRRPSGGDAACAAFVLALTIAYGLFYYGNAPAYGARHLFPAAPCLYLLVARALAVPPHRESGWLDGAHVRGAAIVAAITAIAIAQRPVWLLRQKRVVDFHASRSDLRRIVQRHSIDRGIVESRDPTAVTAAFDPLLDGRDRHIVLDDRSGNVELRRVHPELPLFLALDHDEIGRLYAPPPPPPGLFVELERAWPSFQRTNGLGARYFDFVGASGDAALFVAWSREGAMLTIPFDVSVAGHFALRVDGIAGPDHGDYAIAIDGEPLATWRGWAEKTEKRRGDAVTRDLAIGRHTFIARCIGRAPESTGWLAIFDTLVGEVPIVTAD